jgi:hypothetical protein
MQESAEIVARTIEQAFCCSFHRLNRLVQDARPSVLVATATAVMAPTVFDPLFRRDETPLTTFEFGHARPKIIRRK